jgi:predicted GIY-YIG superfamily endonuclease
MNSFIYVIGCDYGPYKIGLSKHPEKRLKQLQTGFPYKLHVHYTHEVDEKQVRNVEKAIHKIMNYNRTHGEWFNLTLDEAIAEVQYAIIMNGD